MTRETLQDAPRPIDLATFRLTPGTSLIEASAGTGKTFTIQYIVLDLLLQGLDLGEILVVTFTDAATRELRDRLQSFLAEVHAVVSGRVAASGPLKPVLDRAAEELESDALRRIMRRALLHVDAAPIHTIHGFCQRALQENAFAADAAFHAEVCADTSALTQDLVRGFLRMANLELNQPLPRAAGFAALCERAKELTKFLRIRPPCPENIGQLYCDLDTCVEAFLEFQEQVGAIAGELRAFRGKLNARSYPDRFLDGLEEMLQGLWDDPCGSDLRALESLSRSRLEGAFKKEFAGTRLKSAFFDCCEQLLDARRTSESAFLRCFDGWFIREFNRVKEEQGLMTYDDMILDLDRALQNRPALFRQLQSRFRAALVDEFQDTDARQYSIFRKLFGSGSGEGRYFAMIGDPKQSIYAFRGADVRAYLRAREDAGFRYTLPTNYRSEAGLVEGVNRFLEGVDLGEREDDRFSSIPFHPVESGRSADGWQLLDGTGARAAGLITRNLDTPADGKLAAARADCLGRLVEDVAELLGRSKEGRIVLEHPVTGERRSLHPGDIAVLVDQHAEAAELQERFAQAGLLAVRSKSGDVFQTEEALHFLQFLRSCLSPDERRLNVLLVSPLHGLDDAGVQELGSARRQSIHELYSMLGREWLNGASVSTIWTRFLTATDARERLLARQDGERRLTNYLHLAELAQELERAQSLSPERLTERFLRMVKMGSYGAENETEEHLVRLESDEDAIKLLTMHASKGLEFPVVFLPSLWQKSVRNKGAPVAQACPEDPDCLEGFMSDPDAAVRRQRSEALRIGYVALTRAVHLCFYYRVEGMEVKQGNLKDGWFDQWMLEQRKGATAESDACYFERLRNVPVAEVPEQPLKPQPLPRVLSRTIPDSYQITSYSALARLTKAERPEDDPLVRGGDEEAIADASAVQERDSSAADDLLLAGFPGGVRTGTFVHEVLERVDLTVPGQWPPVVIRLLQRHFAETSGGLFRQRLEEVLQLLRELSEGQRELANGQVLDWQSLRRDGVLREMEFYFPVHSADPVMLERIIDDWLARQGMARTQPAAAGHERIDGFLTGSIDLFFGQNQCYHVLDWKTNAPPVARPRIRSSYDRRGMQLLMADGRYYLQALIYSTAATVYLKDRLRDAFDYERHVGGFVYCFVRGLGPGTGWLTGRFDEADISRATEALGQQSHRPEANVHA